MDAETAYILCRKRASQRWRNRWYDWEDVAHDAWLLWLRQPDIHPYVHVTCVISAWLKAMTCTKRKPRNVQLHHDDHPIGPILATEFLAKTLQELIDHSTKPAVRHVAKLLCEGYTIREIGDRYDYGNTFLENVRTKVHLEMRFRDAEYHACCVRQNLHGSEKARLVRNLERQRRKRI